MRLGGQGLSVCLIKSHSQVMFWELGAVLILAGCLERLVIGNHHLFSLWSFPRRLRSFSHLWAQDLSTLHYIMNDNSPPPLSHYGCTLIPWLQPWVKFHFQVRPHPAASTCPEPAVVQKAPLAQGLQETPLAGPRHSTATQGRTHSLSQSGDASDTDEKASDTACCILRRAVGSPSL